MFIDILNSTYPNTDTHTPQTYTQTPTYTPHTSTFKQSNVGKAWYRGWLGERKVCPRWPVLPRFFEICVSGMGQNTPLSPPLILGLSFSFLYFLMIWDFRFLPKSWLMKSNFGCFAYKLNSPRFYVRLFYCSMISLKSLPLFILKCVFLYPIPSPVDSTSFCAFFLGGDILIDEKYVRSKPPLFCSKGSLGLCRKIWHLACGRSVKCGLQTKGVGAQMRICPKRSQLGHSHNLACFSPGNIYILYLVLYPSSIQPRIHPAFKKWRVVSSKAHSVNTHALGGGQFAQAGDGGNVSGVDGGGLGGIDNGVAHPLWSIFTPQASTAGRTATMNAPLLRLIGCI